MTVDNRAVTDEEPHMRKPHSDMELLSTLDFGVHIEYETRSGEYRSGIVLSEPMPSVTNRVVVRVHCDQSREVRQVPWQRITEMEPYK